MLTLAIWPANLLHVEISTAVYTYLNNKYALLDTRLDASTPKAGRNVLELPKHIT